MDTAQRQKVAAALMKAGISNPAAWSAAGVPNPGVQVIPDVSSAVSAWGGSGSGTKPDSANVFDLHPAVALRKGTNDKTFLISWRSQTEVARSLGWKCMLMIWGGPALALLSLYLFLSMERLL
jgi:hypothetical protein